MVLIFYLLFLRVEEILRLRDLPTSFRSLDQKFNLLGPGEFYPVPISISLPWEVIHKVGKVPILSFFLETDFLKRITLQWRNLIHATSARWWRSMSPVIKHEDSYQVKYTWYMMKMALNLCDPPHQNQQSQSNH